MQSTEHRPTQSTFTKVVLHTIRLLLPKPKATPVDMTGKYVLVTGGSENSIGFSTAKVLADWGANVSATCLTDCEILQEKFRRETSASANEVSVYQLDLTDRNSVNSFVKRYKEDKKGRLDVLVNNAGIHKNILKREMEPPRSTDGYEVHWRTNYLGTYQLSRLLLPLLLEAPRSKGFPRIINVVSHLHDCVPNDVLFTGVSPYSSWKAYGRSKLALLHFTKELNRRFAAEGLHAFALHPGSAATNLVMDGTSQQPRMRQGSRVLQQLNRLFLLSPMQGAQTSIACASDPDFESGGYYERCELADHAQTANDVEVAKVLWKQSDLWFNSISKGEHSV